MFNKTVAYVIIFGLLILVRGIWIPEGGNTTHFITGVNCLSYFLVIISIREVVADKISEEIKSFNYTVQVQKNEIKKCSKRSGYLCIVMCLVLVYFILRSSDKNNDILAIITIALSLLYEEIGCMLYSLERKMRK